MELAGVIDELYAIPPEQFIAARTARQDDARAGGDPVLAREIGGLGKPSAAAWACNLLVRDQRGMLEELVALGDQLRSAQQNLAGDQLRTLDVQRRQVLAALTRQARSLTHAQGHPVSTGVATQVEQTLRAAMTDPEAARALLAGALTSPMSYSGLGATIAEPHLRLVQPPSPQREPLPTTAPTTAPTAPPGRTRAPGQGMTESTADRRVREREERRRAAEEQHRRVLARAWETAAAALTAAEEAAVTATEQRAEVDRSAADGDRLQARVDELAEQLAEAERAAGAAATALKRAQHRSTAADRAAEDAAEERERSAARVAQLTDRDDA